jgi:hypothetical protein
VQSELKKIAISVKSIASTVKHHCNNNSYFIIHKKNCNHSQMFRVKGSQVKEFNVNTRQLIQEVTRFSLRNPEL